MQKIAVLGASGLIGEAITHALRIQGHDVTPIARRFTTGQTLSLETAVETDFTSLDDSDLFTLIDSFDVIINCVGILQDTPSGNTKDVHTGFVSRLVSAMTQDEKQRLLIHLSIPGQKENDTTPFATTKREAEGVISSSSLDHIILRPGFVYAPGAFGGSALLRSVAALPIDLPDEYRAKPFRFTAVQDIADTVLTVIEARKSEKKSYREIWDVMSPEPQTVGTTVDALRRWLGGPGFRVSSPKWLIAPLAKTGDFAAKLGWRPPLRTTAIKELERGVEGDPSRWLEATGLKPTHLLDALQIRPATIQERWFSRLYLLKALILPTLFVFWTLSGLIALTVAFDAASNILTSHGFPLWAAYAITVVSSLIDILVGLAIVWRRTCAIGLLAGIGVSIFYMIGAAILTPDMWIEPLGALVKTGPAIVLMLVGLAILDDR
ncbi:SDR family oxidoreductase [Roseibium sp.]|uniref:SDR family oxidoreductase n=1 Tax=Roseibium sp. TaxID=1936156 RepID=UPI003B519287